MYSVLVYNNYRYFHDKIMLLIFYLFQLLFYLPKGIQRSYLVRFKKHIIE